MTPPPAPRPPAPRRESLLPLAVGLVLVGAVMTLAGDLYYGSAGLSWAGTVVAIVGGVAYAVLRLVGRRDRSR